MRCHCSRLDTGTVSTGCTTGADVCAAVSGTDHVIADSLNTSDMHPSWSCPNNIVLHRTPQLARLPWSFCDVVDLVETSQNRILEARVGIEPA